MWRPAQNLNKIKPARLVNIPASSTNWIQWFSTEKGKDEKEGRMCGWGQEGVGERERI